MERQFDFWDIGFDWVHHYLSDDIRLVDYLPSIFLIIYVIFSEIECVWAEEC